MTKSYPNTLFIFTAMNRWLPLFFAALFVSCEEAPDTRSRFLISIENLSGTEQVPGVILSSGVFFTQTSGSPLFFNFSFDYGDGLEWLAEDGIIDTLLSTLPDRQEVVAVGGFPDILPGETLSFEVDAQYGQFFNLATMFTESNDLFYAFHDGGLNLFEPNGDPINGDLTEELFLWDLGSERNEQPYVGASQPGRQPDFNFGESTPSDVVQLVDDGFAYPAVNEVVRITFNAINL